MSSRFNGYRQDERPPRPSSEQLVDLHVYLVPPEIWREKFNNALNQNINDTVSLGFIRVDPETKIVSLRDEIDQQLGSDLVPREYVFLKSVGRSLTRLKSKQENQLKAKHFLPPKAYAPELYLLEATPEVRAVFAASSEGSTRPQTRTSFDYNPYTNSQSEDPTFQQAKYTNLPNGGSLQSHYTPLPQISSRSQHPRDPRFTERSNSPSQTQSSSHPTSHPVVVRQSPSPRDSHTHRDTNRTNGPILQQSNWDEPVFEQSNYNYANSNKLPRDSRLHDTDSYRAYPDYQQPVASSPRRVSNERPNEEYLPPLSATPTHSPEGEGKQNSSQKKHQHNEDSGIAGFTPDDQTHRENQDDVLDRRKPQLQENHDINERLRPPSPEKDDQSSDSKRIQDDLEMLEWERQRREQQDKEKREEEERKRREEEEKRREEENRERIAEEAKLLKTKSDEELARYPSPPPLRLASPERDTASAKERRKREKDDLMKELAEAREGRRAAERHREELVRQAKQMQNKTQNRRNHARDIWKKRYFEEKKKTGPFEEQCNRLRHELDIIHKKLLTTLEGPREKATKLQDFKPPSNKVGLTTGTVSQDYGTTSPHWAPHQSRSPAPLTVSSPRRGNSSRLELSPIRRSSLSPSRRRDISPGKKLKIPYVLTSRNLEKVQKQKAQSFQKTQYPVSLIGSDDKKQLLEKELFYDSNLNSPEPSNRSPYNSGASRGYESPRKNVQFDNTVAVIPQEGN